MTRATTDDERTLLSDAFVALHANEEQLDASPQTVPDASGYSRADLIAALPGPWTPPVRERFADALEAVGVLRRDGVQLAGLIAMHEGELPEGDDGVLNLADLWGAEADANIQAVNAWLTQLRKHSPADHDELLPFVQRVSDVTNLVLAVAKRQRRRA